MAMGTWDANAYGYWVSSESSDNEKAHQGDDTCVKETQACQTIIDHLFTFNPRNMDTPVPTSPPYFKLQGYHVA